MTRLAVRLLISLFPILGFALPPGKGTVPLLIEEQRIFVDAQFTRADGSFRSARLWVDTGTPDFQITEKLAKDLGLDMSAPPIKSEDGIQQSPVKLPGVQIGGVSLDLQNVKPMVILGQQNLFPGSQTEGNLPATILMHYQVVLDIPHRTLSLLQPGTKAKGQRTACLVQPQTGMIQIEASIDGKEYGLALDSGAPYSMISSDAIRAWSTQHADWPHIASVAGPATFLPPHLRRGSMMRIPQIQWGGVPLRNVAVASMDPEFVSWYSKKTAAPVMGFLAWNVLQAFRITIDYKNSVAYFEKRHELDSHDMDTVGLALAQSRTGGYAIVAVVQKDGHPTVEEAQRGDKLLKVDGLDATDADLQTIVNALRGKPGDSRTLVLDRKGQTLTVNAKVMRLI